MWFACKDLDWYEKILACFFCRTLFHLNVTWLKSEVVGAKTGMMQNNGLVNLRKGDLISIDNIINFDWLIASFMQ